MFCSRKRPFSFIASDNESINVKAKCFCPTREFTHLPVNNSHDFSDRTANHETMETNICSNNNTETECDRNPQTLPVKQHNCRQCLAGQGGHFMHLSSDSNNNR
ncbi:Hypothetical predicted protein [Mytilus galloprovincialis]|uniref:Uncharacterized protein n=1 Tax=Mytilus galloprovincialis TaxID=29158 RepID=A0A8B6BMU7_MYTGA|nr:Hypothetical predicted protein [Mytilus galloprovincialis]